MEILQKRTHFYVRGSKWVRKSQRSAEERQEWKVSEGISLAMRQTPPLCIGTVIPHVRLLTSWFLLQISQPPAWYSGSRGFIGPEVSYLDWWFCWFSQFLLQMLGWYLNLGHIVLNLSFANQILIRRCVILAGTFLNTPRFMEFRFPSAHWQRKN